MHHNTRPIAGLVGPTMVAILVSENPWVQPTLYAEQIPPVIYLNGTLMLLGGLAVVRNHNHWALDGSLPVTLVGWTSIAIGLVRMFLAEGHRAVASTTPDAAFLAFEIPLLALALWITWVGYRPLPAPEAPTDR